MKILTFNLWHGLGHTRLGIGPLEAPGRSELRLQGFLSRARAAGPDLVCLQEANPAPAVARRVAAALDMEEIHQVCNAGIKLPWGFPRAFRSGIVLLARPEFQLRKQGVVKLPGSGRGWCWDRFSLQVREHRYALFGRVAWDGAPVLVAVTHLHHVRPLEPQAVEEIRRARRRGLLSGPACRRLLYQYEQGATRRRRELEAITARLRAAAPGGRAILCGDFNVEPEAREIRTLVEAQGFTDTYAQAGTPPGHTWDPGENPHIAASRGAFLGRDVSRREIRALLERQDMRPGRLDYIFLGPGFSPEQVAASRRFATRPGPGGLFCSDHFGVLTTLRSTPGQERAGIPLERRPARNGQMQGRSGA